MEFYLQIGHGMMGHSRHFIERWGGGAVILSPRDLEPGQLVRLADDIHERGGEVLLDPQFYLPDATHERLREHSYWPDQYESEDFWAQGGDHRRLIAELHGLNRRLGCETFILPGLHAEELTDEWYGRQDGVQRLASGIRDDEQGVYASVALSPEIMRDRDSIQELLRVSDGWDVDGVYLVPEHPPNQYLVTSPIWLSNLLDLIAGWRLDELDVVVGYCNQQMLITASVSPTAIASGNWRNVRSFPPDKFYTREEIRRHSTWYYVPHALSEYQLEFLDMAQAQGVLEDMVVPEELQGGYARNLFAGPQPSTVEFSNSPGAFRHYLHCLRQQIAQARKRTYPETMESCEELLNTALQFTEQWRRRGVFGAYREFGEDEHDASTSALTLLDTNRGPILRRQWDDLSSDGD